MGMEGLSPVPEARTWIPIPALLLRCVTFSNCLYLSKPDRAVVNEKCQ